LIAAGDFTMAGGVMANRIARWDGKSWSAFGTGMNNSVSALTVYNGELVAGGSFTSADGRSANRVARWDGSSWQALGNGFADFVLALTVHDGQLIAGGKIFHRASRWDGAAWQPMGGELGETHAFTAYGGQLPAAGTVGGGGGPYVSTWNGSAWLPFGSQLFNGGVSAFAVLNDQLVAGDSFSFVGSVAAKRIARLVGSSWQPLGEGANESIKALAVYRSELIAGGVFTKVGNGVSAYFGRWTDTGCLGSRCSRRPRRLSA
jgi:hypothetical protein